MRALASERFTLADAAQSVVDGAQYETECYVTVKRIDALEACIPAARAIEAATRTAIAAIDELLACYRTEIYPDAVIVDLRAKRDALAGLIGYDE